MVQKKVLIAFIASLIFTLPAQAYLGQVENTTTGTVRVKINLAAHEPINMVLKPGEKSAIFDTGIYCFQSIQAIGLDKSIKGMDTGDFKPWPTPMQCFFNLRFQLFEEQSNGVTTGIGIKKYNLEG